MKVSPRLIYKQYADTAEVPSPTRHSPISPADAEVLGSTTPVGQACSLTSLDPRRTSAHVSPPVVSQPRQGPLFKTASQPQPLALALPHPDRPSFARFKIITTASGIGLHAHQPSRPPLTLPIMVFCAYCGKSFTRKEHLERHIPSRKTPLPLGPLPVGSLTLQRRHQCQASPM